jgi:hypothetical protein
MMPTRPSNVFSGSMAWMIRQRRGDLRHISETA